jgi:hypothetical protein
MLEYYILTQDPLCASVFDFIKHHGLRCEVHLNRTRFWLPEGSVYTEFALRFSNCCPRVDPRCDLATGLLALEHQG